MNILWLLGVLAILCLAVVIKDVFFDQDEPEKASKPTKRHFWREVTITKMEE
jgi:hypothetical protein